LSGAGIFLHILSGEGKAFECSSVEVTTGK
jgi:hypothetical protein